MTAIPKPCKEEVEKYLKKWENLENYRLQESSLNKLFFSTYKNNDCIEDILIKVCSLNDFYSTNIFSPADVAKHILSLKIDKALESGDIKLVDKIARVSIRGKNKNFYSFATKYCSHHNPKCFPIYDSYVEKVLIYFQKRDNFFEFDKNDLKNYPKFKNALIQFKEKYNLTEYNLKEIDRYLWQVGKEYFVKQFKKKKSNESEYKH